MAKPTSTTPLTALSDYRKEIASQLDNIKKGTGVSAKLAESRRTAESAATNLMTEIEKLLASVLAKKSNDKNIKNIIISNSNILEAEKFLKLHKALIGCGMLTDKGQP